MTHHDLENGQASSCLIKTSHSSCGNTRTSLMDWKQALHLVMSRAIRSCQNIFAMDKKTEGRVSRSSRGSDFLMGASPTRTPRRTATSTSSPSEACRSNVMMSIFSKTRMNPWMIQGCSWVLLGYHYLNQTIHLESWQWWFGPTSDLYGWVQNNPFWTFCENTLLSAHKHYRCFALSETFGQWPLALCKSSHASRMANKAGIFMDWFTSKALSIYKDRIMRIMIQWSNLIWCHPFSSASQPCAWHQLPEHSIHSCTWKQGVFDTSGMKQVPFSSYREMLL